MTMTPEQALADLQQIAHGQFTPVALRIEAAVAAVAALTTPQRPDGVPDTARPLEGCWIDYPNEGGDCDVFGPSGLVFARPRAIDAGGAGVVVPDPPTPQRTGPGGLSEAETRAIAQWEDYQGRAAIERAAIAACRECVAEWDRGEA